MRLNANAPLLFSLAVVFLLLFAATPLFGEDDEQIATGTQATVPVSGTIFKEDGSPLAETVICLYSLGGAGEDFYETTKTDSEGRYSFQVFPERVYSPPQIIDPTAMESHRIFGKDEDDRVVHTGQPVSDFNFTARNVVKVHVKVSFPEDYQEGASQGLSYHDGNGNRFLQICFLEGDPPPDSARGAQQKTATDSHGNKITYWKSNIMEQALFRENLSEPVELTVFLPPGPYTIQGNLESTTFQVGPDIAETTVEVTASNRNSYQNINLPGQQKTVSGRIVRLRGDKMVPVAGAILESENLDKTTSGDDGTFTMEASDDAALYVRSEDFSEVGFVKTSNKDEPVEIELKPVASLKGRLVDSKSGLPVTDSRIECDGPITMYERILTPPYFRNARSDKDGRISMTGFVPGLTYQMGCEPAENADEGVSAMLGFFLALEPGEFDAGDISVIDFRSSNQMIEFIMEPFRREGTAAERFETAKKQAAATHKPVLLVFVEANTDNDNEAFMMWIYQATFGIQGRKYLSDYEYVPIDLSKEVKDKTKAAELLQSLNVAPPEENDFLLCVFGPDGELLTKRNLADFRAPRFKPDGELEVEFDKMLLLTFLREFGRPATP